MKHSQRKGCNDHQKAIGMRSLFDLFSMILFVLFFINKSSPLLNIWRSQVNHNDSITITQSRVDRNETLEFHIILCLSLIVYSCQIQHWSCMVISDLITNGDRSWTLSHGVYVPFKKSSLNFPIRGGRWPTSRRSPSLLEKPLQDLGKDTLATTVNNTIEFIAELSWGCPRHHQLFE